MDCRSLEDLALSVNLVTSEFLRNVNCHQHMGDAALFFLKMFSLTRVGTILQEGNPKLHKHTKSSFLSLFYLLLMLLLFFQT